LGTVNVVIGAAAHTKPLVDSVPGDYLWSGVAEEIERMRTATALVPKREWTYL
jgi:hypothetical protein